MFSIADIRAAHGDFDRRRLSEWQKKGYIKKIVKGYYLFSEVNIDESMLSAIANKIYKPSYISFETAMSHYRLDSGKHLHDNLGVNAGAHTCLKHL